MRKYYHILNLRRSKSLFTSHTSILHRTSHVESHHHKPPPPQPPSPPSYQSTHSNLNRRFVNPQLSTIHTSALPLYENKSALDYQVTVKGREVITAAVTPANQPRQPLSNLDLLLPPIEAGVYFCYKKKDNIDMSPDTVMKTIKKSLAGVLSTFYPLAGQIVPNKYGDLEVLCNNNGVEFVHVHADIEMKDLDLYRPDYSVRGKLVPKLNHIHALLSVQVTELKCGSLIISCTFNHQLTDGYSLNMFLVAWAKYAQSETIFNMPSFQTSLLNPRHPPRYESSVDNLYIPISSLPPPSSFEEPLDSRMYYVHAKSIERIQYEASTKEGTKSKLLSFTAFLWKLLVNGKIDVNTPSRMGIVVNGRRFLAENNEKNASFMENYYGNVVSIPYGAATNRDLKEMPLHEVANQVHRFVAKATHEEHFRGLVDWVQLHRPNRAAARLYVGNKKSEGGGVVVSSGQGLPIKDMDFGWGKPEFGSYHVPWGSQTGYICTMPSACRNGDWVVYMHLKQEEFNVIDHAAPNVFTPLSIDTFF
ncbi:putative alcohol O-acetyltransferase [Helianthus annuus]|nr:putative alcohol O-acetyltransferase [Helianthus annuus]